MRPESSTRRGSPPHVRGRVRHLPGGGLMLRITPACAGKRQMSTFFADMERDHPRMCGEEPGASELRHKKRGSPPHVRGRGPGGRGRPRARGITPARAGKRAGARLSRPIWRDHPRACGEEMAVRPIDAVQVGSPPRMRGRAPPLGFRFGRAGITPAYAGKSALPASLNPGGWDHPRVCGEEPV